MAEHEDTTVPRGESPLRQPWLIALTASMFSIGVLTGAWSRSVVERRAASDVPPADRIAARDAAPARTTVAEATPAAADLPVVSESDQARDGGDAERAVALGEQMERAAESAAPARGAPDYAPAPRRAPARGGPTVLELLAREAVTPPSPAPARPPLVAAGRTAPVPDGAPRRADPAAPAVAADEAAVARAEREVPPPAAEPAEADAVDRDAAVPRAGIDGWWLLTNSIESTSYPGYRGLRLGYRVLLNQDGNRVTGRGMKWSENGRELPPTQRTPIELTGTVDGARVRVRFVEHGRRRTTTGSFSWRLAPDRASLRGDFASTAADTRGSSVAFKR
jgi:hypothetical protein